MRSYKRKRGIAENNEKSKRREGKNYEGNWESNREAKEGKRRKWETDKSINLVH